MSTINWSYDTSTGVYEGVKGSRLAVRLVPAVYGWYSAHVTVGERMRELFSRPVRWGTLGEMKEMLEDANGRQPDLTPDSEVAT
jgi:hypothetical protein